MKEAFSNPPGTGHSHPDGKIDMTDSMTELRPPKTPSIPTTSHPPAMEGGAACVTPASNPLTLKQNDY